MSESVETETSVAATVEASSVLKPSMYSTEPCGKFYKFGEL